MALPIRNMGRIGVVADSPPQDLPPQALTSAVNVEFQHGHARKMLGTQDTGFDFGGNTELTWFQPWIDKLNNRLAFFADDKILYYDGTPTIATAAVPAGLSSSENWQSTVFADWCIANNTIDEPMYSDVKDGSSFDVLPGWAATFGTQAADAMRVFKNVIFALGVGTDDFTVYWCSPGSPETFPTDWDYTSATNNAGRKPLNARDGKLVDAIPLADTLIVYTQFAAYAVSISGDFRVFTFRRLFNWGLANRDCAVQFENSHFCVGREVLYAHDGSRIRRIADNKVEDQFFRENSDLSKTFVTRNAAEHMVLVYYPSGGSKWPNRVMKWLWLEDIFTFEDIPTPDNPNREVRCMGPAILPGAQQTWADLANIGDGSWAALAGKTWADFGTQDDRINMFQLEQPDDDVTAGKFVQRDETQQRQGEEFYAWIERLYIDLDEYRQTADSIVQLNRVLPQMEGTGQVRMMFGRSRSRNSPVLWGSSRLYDLDGNDYKVDTRLAGRYLHYRIGSWPGGNGDPTPLVGTWDITGMDWDVQPDGLR